MYEFLIKGGTIIIPIGLCSILALGVFLERLWSLQRGRIIPDAFILRIEGLIGEICQLENLGMGKVAQPIRVAVSGSTISPSIGKTLVLLGREKTLSRIKQALARQQG